MQAQGILYVMSYAGIAIGDKLDLFRNYFAPAWSVIYWITKSELSKRKLTAQEYEQALCSHAMAMFLHSLDDHLNDGEMPASHLALLLRSQAWRLMNESIYSYIEGVPNGEKTADQFIDRYYSGISSNEEPDTLQKYCHLFRKQMATWTSVPVLTSMKLHGDKNFVKDIQTSYESFGIAWRLLDDVNDIESDIIKSVHSAVYLLLPEEGKKIWDLPEENKDINKLCSIIIECRIVESIVESIIQELMLSAGTVENHRMHELAEEFRTLSYPLETHLQKQP